MNETIVVGIGEVLWDILPEGKRIGGAPANFAYHAAQQGVTSYVVSAIGNDPDGKGIINELKNSGLSVEYLEKNSDFPTGTVSVELKDGIPSYVIHEPVAWDYIPWNSSLEELAHKTDAVCFGTLAQRNDTSANTIQAFLKHTRSDCFKVFDINLRQDFYCPELIESSLNLCDLLKLSDEELPIIANMLGLQGDDNELATALMKRFELKYMVLSKGKDGACFYDRAQTISSPSFDYGPKVDTVGCGDSFTAVLTVGLLEGLDPVVAMNYSSRIAGLVCSSAGAMPEIPDSLKIQ
jgi:fructokinase